MGFNDFAGETTVVKIQPLFTHSRLFTHFGGETAFSPTIPVNFPTKQAHSGLFERTSASCERLRTLNSTEQGAFAVRLARFDKTLINLPVRGA